MVNLAPVFKVKEWVPSVRKVTPASAARGPVMVSTAKSSASGFSGLSSSSCWDAQNVLSSSRSWFLGITSFSSAEMLLSICRARLKDGMPPTWVRSPQWRRTLALGVGSCNGCEVPAVNLKLWVSERIRKVVAMVEFPGMVAG